MKNACTLIAVLTLIFAGCGTTSEPSGVVGTTECADDAAIVRVGDGYLQRVCGCAETDTTPVFAGTAFVCTVTAGETVLFVYQGAKLRHRIISTGTPEFSSGFFYDPHSDSPIQVLSVTLDPAGSYLFEDEYHPTLTGEITVL